MARRDRRRSGRVRLGGSAPRQNLTEVSQLRNATIELRTRRQWTAWWATVILFAVGAAATIVTPALGRAQETRRAASVDDLMAMHRLGDPQISPDGQWVAYSVVTP